MATVKRQRRNNSMINKSQILTRSSFRRIYDKKALKRSTHKLEENMHVHNDESDMETNYLDSSKYYYRNTSQWAQLPREILTKIFSYLTICDTEVVENTCVSWKRACNDPSLWRRVVVNFDGTDSLRLMTDTLRLFSSKGQYIRDLELSIGRPGLNQAWMMSGCIQQLLDFISASPCHNIDTFRISNLVIFTQNRFFKLSKESILSSLNKFLRSQKYLKSVSFSCCRFNPGEGLKVLRALKTFRPTLKDLELHEFFKRRYVSATKAFKIISTLTFLEDLRVDADYLNDNVLTWLVEKWPNRKPLRHVKIYFEAVRPPPNVSTECWLAVRKCFQELKVSYQIGGILHPHWMTPFITEAVPLVDCTIHWYYGRRVNALLCAEHLTNLIRAIAKKQSALLEKFSLHTNLDSGLELEDALLLLVSSCARLTDITIQINTLSEDLITSMVEVFRARNKPVTFGLPPPARSGRPRGMRNRGR